MARRREGGAVQPESRIDAHLDVVLLASIVLGLGSVGLAITMPSDGESFTEVYYLTETDIGELIADAYPRVFDTMAAPVVDGCHVIERRDGLTYEGLIW